MSGRLALFLFAMAFAFFAMSQVAVFNRPNIIGVLYASNALLVVSLVKPFTPAARVGTGFMLLVMASFLYAVTERFGKVGY